MLLISKYFHVFILGVLLVFALPPFQFPVLAVISLALFFIILNKAERGKQAFTLGFLYGASYFLGGIYWLMFPLWQKGFWWLIPIALLFIPTVLALHFAVSSWVFFNLKWRNCFTFALIFTFMEWIRGNIAVYFPWNLIGYTFYSLSIVQVTSIIGIYGLTFIIIIFSCSLTDLFTKNLKWYNYFSLAIIFSSVIYVEVWGYIRGSSSAYLNTDVKLRIVQANISRPLKWSHQYAYETLNSYLKLTTAPGFDLVDCVIWPETSIPFLISLDKPYFLKQVFGLYDKYFIIGADRENGEKIANSIFLIGKKGELLDIYDKQNLVPFGEYVPFKKILRLEKFVHGIKDYSKGEEKQKVITVPQLFSFAPTICYEDIFCDFITKEKVEVIVNTTNDSWFGTSTAPYQHFQMGRIRSIEEGIPTIKAASTGISALIDSYGRIINNIPLNTQGVLDVFLPKAISTTFYKKYYLYINAALVIGGSFLCLLSLINFVLFNFCSKGKV